MAEHRPWRDNLAGVFRTRTNQFRRNARNRSGGLTTAYYYFLPQLFYTALSDFKAGLGQRFPVDLKALCVRLKDAGRLETYRSEKREYNAKRICCEGQLQTVLKIRRPKSEKLDTDATMPQMQQENQ